MKELNEYILEKFKISKNNISEKVWIILYKYDFDIEDFVWDTLDTVSFDEVLDNIAEYGECYEVYKDVPMDPIVEGEIIEAAKDVKFDRISYSKFNNILKKYGVNVIGAESIWDMINRKKKRMKKNNEKN